jgi:hypothetical protein
LTAAADARLMAAESARLRPDSADIVVAGFSILTETQRFR